LKAASEFGAAVRESKAGQGVRRDLVVNPSSGTAMPSPSSSTSQKIVRLRQGDSHAGWLLSSVQGREVTIKKADQSEVLGLQRQVGAARVPGTPTVPVAPVPIIPAAAGFNTPYSPFVPRSTPKNGQSDGL